MLRGVSGIVGRLLRLAILISAIVVAVKVGAWLLSDTSVEVIGLSPAPPTPDIVGLTPVVNPDSTTNLTLNAVPIAVGLGMLVVLTIIGLLLTRRLRRPRLRQRVLSTGIPQPLLPQTRGLPIYQPGALTRSARPGMPTPNTGVNPSADYTTTASPQMPKQTHIFRRPPAPETRLTSPTTRPVSLDNTRPMPGVPVPPPPLTQPEWPPTPSYGTDLGTYGSYDDLFPPAEPGEDRLLQDIFGTLAPSSLEDDAPTEKIEPSDPPRPAVQPTSSQVHSTFGAGRKRRPILNRRKAPRQPHD